MKTKEMLEKARAVLLTNKVAVWYKENLIGTKQSDTMENLERGIRIGDLSIREALYLSFIVGFQWHEDFEKAEKEG